MDDGQEADDVDGQGEGLSPLLERDGFTEGVNEERPVAQPGSRSPSPKLPVIHPPAHSPRAVLQAQDETAINGIPRNGAVGTKELAQDVVSFSSITHALLPDHQAAPTSILEGAQDGNSAADQRTERQDKEVQIQYIGNGDTVDGELQATAVFPYGSSIADIAVLDSAASMTGTDCPTRIQAFAKLEFDDGQFYMNTYSVELGRDIRAARVAFQSGFSSDHEVTRRSHKRSNSSADANQVGRALKQEESRTMANSVVSETGGIIGLDISDPENRRKSRRRKAKSTSSSSHNISRKSSMRIVAPQTDYQSLAMASLTDPRSIDALTFLPSPEECPLIPIHPPAVAEGSSTGHRGISRRHVRIAYNFERRLFELVVQGKNGAFVDEQYLEAGETQELKSGSYIQIGGVGIRFVLPDVAIGETGAEGTLGSDLLSGGAMSFDFEDGRGESLTMADSEVSTTGDDDESLPNGEREVRGPNRFQNLDDGEDLEADGDDDSDSDSDSDSGDELEDEIQEQKTVRRPKISLKISKPKPEAKPEPETVFDPSVIPPRRKGPGRPPKNGIISKREQALIARQAREAAKAEALKNGTGKPGKGKSGKPSNDDTATPPLSEVKTEKRKYTKRKKAEDQTEEPPETREMTEKTDSIPPEQALPAPPPKPAKEKRPPKPPRSPSPVFDEATLTPEQLAKPAQSYVILIHEALTNSKTGAMSLPQIYRAIERRYPYYKLRVQTTGWQSSVRHNLSQHPAFRKIERDGKGWMWGLVPEISIEKEKKRRPSPPLVPPQHYHPPGPHMYRPPYPYPSMPPPNGHLPPPMGHPPYAMLPGMPPPPHGYPPYPGGVPRALNGVPLPLAAQTDNDSTYRSPYQPPPPSQPAAPSQPQPQTSPEQPPSSARIPQVTVPDPSNTKDLSTNAPKQTPPPPPIAGPPYHHPSNPAPNRSPQQSTKAPTPAPSHHDNSIGQSILKSVGDFKSVLLASLSYKPNAEEIVQQAINRTLGIAVAAEEFPEEAPIMSALRTMIDGMRQKDRAQRQASTPAPLSAHETPKPQVPASDIHAPPPPSPSAPPPPYPGPADAATVQPPPPQTSPSQAQLLAILQRLEPRKPPDTTPNQAKLVAVPANTTAPDVPGSTSPASEQKTPAGRAETPEHTALAPNGVVALEGAKNVNTKRGLDDDDEDAVEEPGIGAGLRQAKRVAV
ncbi:hypothetical protein MMC26_004432 [Xylographa opegraphella]|nr:hypothetical protein [Xylographa opegraphella]